ncbi:hypothetical protein DAI22_04g090950 [Oryza sativa Japonica Group]|nr:hypothetical protein DAI22_04g090950 [Oryza sativa Japonica Group]
MMCGIGGIRKFGSYSAAAQINKYFIGKRRNPRGFRRVVIGNHRRR